MTDPTLDLQTLAERLDEVEKKNHKLKNLGIALALLGIIGGFFGGIISARIFNNQITTTPSKILAAEEICLLDQHGMLRAGLTTMKDGQTTLFLGGKDGKGGVALSVTADGVPHLVFTDKDGKRRINLGLSEENGQPAFVIGGKDDGMIILTMFKNDSAELSFSGKGNKYPSIIMSTEQGIPNLSLCDNNGKNRITLSIGKDESSGLNFNNKDGKNVITIGNSADHNGINLYDNNSKCGIGLHSDGSPTLGLVDENGKHRAFLALEDGRPSLKLYDEKGITRTAIGSVDLVTKSTGTETRRPLSSLVFFNDKGEVIWKAPAEH